MNDLVGHTFLYRQDQIVDADYDGSDAAMQSRRSRRQRRSNTPVLCIKVFTEIALVTHVETTSGNRNRGFHDLSGKIVLLRNHLRSLGHIPTRDGLSKMHAPLLTVVTSDIEHRCIPRLLCSEYVFHFVSFLRLCCSSVGCYSHDATLEFESWGYREQYSCTPAQST